MGIWGYFCFGYANIGLVFCAFALALATPLTFTVPQPWAIGFAPGAWIPLAGDVDNDGYCDLIRVNPDGEGGIDVGFTIDGQRCSFPQNVSAGWGKGLQAAVAGDFDDKPGTDVLGLFDGQILKLAGGFKDGKYAVSDFLKLPAKLKKPFFGQFPLSVISSETGDGYVIDALKRTATPMKFPKKLVWLDAGLAMRADGQLGMTKADRFFASKDLPKLDPKSRPALAGSLIAFNGKVFQSEGGETITLPSSKLPPCPEVSVSGDFDHNGTQDVMVFRYGSEMHTGNDVLLYRNVNQSDADWDHDGLTNEEEAKLGTDPLNPDTDGDGYLDGWEVHGYRGLDLPKLGCNPRKMDVVCLVSRFASVAEDRVHKELERVIKTYSELPVKNVDGSAGWGMHLIYKDPIKDPDDKNPWWTNRDKFLPREWRGLVHWMQVTPGGGGQADQLGDGGTVGQGALWAVFLHEFGHQIGMDHNGFWSPGFCPIYPSLMNYAYSYGYDDDYNKIHYSDGRLDGYVLNETDLDETIPLPYEKVKFLEKGPYHFRLKPNGKTTLIDWNWNGVFGEKHIRADINYSYATSAGNRQQMDLTECSPWLFTHEKKAYALVGHTLSPEDKTDRTISPEKPGALLLRRMIKPWNWEKELTIEPNGLIGDAVAVSHAGWIVALYPMKEGVAMRRVKEDRPGHLLLGDRTVLDSDSSKVPTVGQLGDRAFLFLWNPATQEVTYRILEPGSWTLSPEFRLYERSSNPVGMSFDTVRHQIILGMAQDQPKGKVGRWQVRHYVEDHGRLTQAGPVDWVEGEAGGSRGTGRIVILFAANRDTGPLGRVYLFCRGTTSKESPYACSYVAEQIADKTVHGGWLVKRFYDEWSQTASAPAAMWFNNDIMFAYRWAGNNYFHLGYEGLGIDKKPMGDHDDLSYFRDFGIRHAITYLNRL